MTDLHTADTQLATTPADAVIADRRRPGRPNKVSPALIPLLRDPHSAGNALPEDDAFPSLEALAEIGNVEDDDLNAVRGIGVGPLLATPFWATVLYLVFR